MSLYILLFFILINLKEYKNMLLKGKRAQDGQFPWLIQFQTIAPCGGVLLSADWVLTAAQCVQDKRNSITLFATGLNGNSSKQTLPVKATYIYPTYEAYSVLPDRDHNIALLKLTKPFDMCHAKVVLPKVVPVKYDDDNKLCLIFGWQSYVSPSSKVLAKPIQYYDVILSSLKMCTYMTKTNTNYTNLFCAMVEFKDEMKACAGNPGSPLICENQNHEITLVGIASWTNFSLECGNFPTYIDLGGFRMWMNDLISNKKNIRECKNNSRVNETQCTFKEDSNIYHRSWNNADLLQLGSQISCWPKETKVQLHNMSKTAMKYQEIFIKNISNEPSNNIYKYKKVGNSQNNKKIIENLNNKKKFIAINKSLLCNNQQFDKITVQQNKDQVEIDDFELLLPFNFEDITASYSSIVIIYPKRLYLFFQFVFWNFYIIIYT